MAHPTYEVITTPSGLTTINAYYENGVILSIPADESNSDYQRYLRWVENPDADESGTL